MLEILIFILIAYQVLAGLIARHEIQRIDKDISRLLDSINEIHGDIAQLEATKWAK